MNRRQRRAAAARGRKQRPTGYADQLFILSSVIGDQPPGLHHVFVEHDDWCRMLNGGGECNCYPNVRMRRADGLEIIAAE